MDYTIYSQLISEGFKAENLNEDLLEEGKMKAAIISLAMGITSALVGAGIWNGQKQKTYNNELVRQLSLQASSSDIARGKADFMFDGNRIQYDTNSNVLKINGKKMKENKAVKKTTLNGGSVEAIRGQINNQKNAKNLENLRNTAGENAVVNYDANADVYNVKVNKSDIATISEIKNNLVKLGYKIIKQSGRNFQLQKNKGWFNY